MARQPISVKLSHTVAIRRLTFWQQKLEDAKKAGDEEGVENAARFIEAYGGLIAEMIEEQPPRESD